jgi:general L-amino acid transport system substrate-binding protein
MVYAAPATYSPTTGILKIPKVEVHLDNGKTLCYRAEMQQIEPSAQALKFQAIDAAPSNCVTEGFFLKRVRDNKSLLCGGRTGLPGFGYTCPDNSNCGFDIDLCRAVAAAVLNLSTGPITFDNVSTDERKEVLIKADVDMLSRNVTWTAARNAEWGNFTWVMFYDAQGFMVRSDSGIDILPELDEKNICVVRNTTSYENLVDYFAREDLTFTPILVEEASDFFPKLVRKECDAATTDKWSGLHSRLAGNDQKENFKIIEGTISREPLSPIVPKGDEQWLNIVKLVMFALINAEYFGITQDNVDRIMSNDKDPKIQKMRNNPKIRRLLGIEGSFGQENLGLEKEAIAQAIRAVGNYGDIFDRYFSGKDSNSIKIDREKSDNELWRNDGLIYAPPMGNFSKN